MQGRAHTLSVLVVCQTGSGAMSKDRPLVAPGGGGQGEGFLLGQADLQFLAGLWSLQRRGETTILRCNRVTNSCRFASCGQVMLGACSSGSRRDQVWSSPMAQMIQEHERKMACDIIFWAREAEWGERGGGKWVCCMPFYSMTLPRTGALAVIEPSSAYLATLALQMQQLQRVCEVGSGGGTSDYDGCSIIRPCSLQTTHPGVAPWGRTLGS